MLCSISTQKSGSRWLDRLRSSKGFPFADHTNLEQFLTPNGSETHLRDNKNNNNSSTVSTDPIRSVTETPAALDNRGQNEQLSNVVSNVLSELFCMGESTTFPKFNVKRTSRKQTNPRFCASSENDSVAVAECGRGKGEIALSPMSDGNSRVEVKDSQVKLLEQGNDLKLAEEEEEEDKSHANLLGFSRTEVTVIDTSCAPWKFEKLLFRKKNVWKVRDKKSKTINLGKKKRKADVADEDVSGKKKHKVTSGHDDYGSSKGGMCKFPVDEKLRLNDKSDETCKRRSDSIGQASKKRQRDLKLKKASSSVVLIKNIPTSKKNGTSISKNSLKPSQRQYQA